MRAGLQARRPLSNRPLASKRNLDRRIGFAFMTSPVPLTLPPQEEQVFPTLTPEQIARVSAHGRTRTVQGGEVLVEAGQQYYPFFVAISAELEVLRKSMTGDE